MEVFFRRAEAELMAGADYLRVFDAQKIASGAVVFSLPADFFAG